MPRSSQQNFPSLLQKRGAPEEVEDQSAHTGQEVRGGVNQVVDKYFRKKNRSKLNFFGVIDSQKK